VGSDGCCSALSRFRETDREEPARTSVRAAEDGDGNRVRPGRVPSRRSRAHAARSRYQDQLPLHLGLGSITRRQSGPWSDGRRGQAGWERCPSQRRAPRVQPAKKPDPSIATEFGALLSGINDQHGTGAVLNGIVWQRWDWERFTSTLKLRLPASSMPITFSTRSSKVRRTGRCDRSQKYFMKAIFTCLEPAQPWLAQSGRSKTMSLLTLSYLAGASMAQPLAKFAPA
jgi:hypothetical protein